MLPEVYTAFFIAACLAIFFPINLFNLVRTRHRRSEKAAQDYAEVKRPQGFIFAFAAFGTLFFFLTSFAYPLLVFNQIFYSSDFPLQLHFQYDSYIQVVGIALEVGGYFLFLWSVLERGRYAVSWEMPENHRLVTWGPYRYVRHPSYLAYFLLFFGLFFILLNLVAVVPLVAIPGYVSVTHYEEQLLKRRFRGAYVEYQRRTGRFFPKLRRERF